MLLLDEIRFQEPSWFWISEGQSEAVPGGWCPCLLDLLPSLISAFLLQVSLQVQPLHGFAPTLSFPQREGQGRVTAFKRAIEKNSLKSWKLEMCQNSTHWGAHQAGNKHNPGVSVPGALEPWRKEEEVALS